MKRLLVLLALASSAAPPALASGTVGTGTPGTCTEGALDAALAGGGTVTFNCGGGPVVIPVTTTKILSVSTTIDGTGQQVTLDGGGTTKMFLTTYQLAAGLDLVLRRLTLRHGRAPERGAAIEMVWQEPTRLTRLL